MNNTHDNGEKDRSLNESLDKLGRDYARLEGDEPPELLDMAILNTARRAVEKKPHWMKFGWLHGLTTAAVFVLALSLIVHQREQPPSPGTGIQADRPSRSAAEGAAEFHSSKTQSDQLRQPFKNEQKDLHEPGAAPPVDKAQTQALGDAVREYRATAPDERSPQSDAGSADEDNLVPTRTMEAEETDTGASKPGSLSVKPATGSEFSRPAAVAGPAATEKEMQGAVDDLAEEQLRAIIRMKREGDEFWKTELKSFIEAHPGYPLPDELKY